MKEFNAVVFTHSSKVVNWFSLPSTQNNSLRYHFNSNKTRFRYCNVYDLFFKQLMNNICYLLFFSVFVSNMVIYVSYYLDIWIVKH